MSGCAIGGDFGLVRNVLTTVDCNTRYFAQLGYESLGAPNSPFQTALTLVLIIYVALVGYRLLLGHGATLSDGPIMALKIGAVLALVTSWSLFQTLVFDLAERAPVELAAIISAPVGGRVLVKDPIGAVQTAYDEVSNAASGYYQRPGSAPGKAQENHAMASQALALAGDSLFAASAGLIAVITIIIGLLTAAGPLFIALFLFLETRSFFFGWIRALAASAFGLLSTWSLTIVMLEAIDPWMHALADASTMGQADARIGLTIARIVLIFCAAQFGLLLTGILIAWGTRIPAARNARTSVAPEAIQQSPSLLTVMSRPAHLAEHLTRYESALLLANRASSTASAASRSNRDFAGGSGQDRIGDMYRRPTVTAESRPA